MYNKKKSVKFQGMTETSILYALLTNMSKKQPALQQMWTNLNAFLDPGL